MTAVGLVLMMIGLCSSIVSYNRYTVSLSRAEASSILTLFIGSALFVVGVAIKLWELMP